MLDYIRIARPDHWIKNVFAIPGLVFGSIFAENSKNLNLSALLLVAIILCTASSANYTINEWLDRFSDLSHPEKYTRPAAQGRVKFSLVITQYFTLIGLSTYTAHILGDEFLALTITFLILGLIYNVEPFRTKDRMYLDVISESANNPVRFLFGWALVSDSIPPSSALLGYWTAGTFLMTMKRYGEKKQLMVQLNSNLNAIEIYRPSLARYSLPQLFSISIFCAILTSAFLGIFMSKYSEFLVVTLPSLAYCFIEYFRIAERENSPAQHPENLYKETRLLFGAGSFLFLSILAVLLERSIA